MDFVDLEKVGVFDRSVNVVREYLLSVWIEMLNIDKLFSITGNVPKYMRPFWDLKDAVHVIANSKVLSVVTLLFNSKNKIKLTMMLPFLQNNFFDIY